MRLFLEGFCSAERLEKSYQERCRFETWCHRCLDREVRVWLSSTCHGSGGSICLGNILIKEKCW
jgi:hypothetical protein